MNIRIDLLILALCCFCFVQCSTNEQAEQRGPETQKTSEATYTDLGELAERIAGEAKSDIVRSERIIIWLNEKFTWTDTDYKNRTVQEIIARQGGNCAEQVRVARALLDEIGIRTRRIAEINIQPKNEQRQEDAEAVIKRQGLKASIFGLRHNDHRWIEIYDNQSKSWIPADPSLGLIGLENWLNARVGFGSRPTHDILPSRDMLVPIAIFAMDDKEAAILEDRSEYYLVDEFNELYHGALQTKNAWKDWKQLIDEIVPRCKAAFLWEENLHEQNSTIEQIAAVYEKLKTENLKSQ